MKFKGIVLDADVAHDDGDEFSYVRLIVKSLDDGNVYVLYDPLYRYYFYVLPREPSLVKDLKDEISAIRVVKSNEAVSPLKTEIVKKVWGIDEVDAVKVYLKKPSHYLDIKDVIASLPEYQNGGKKLEKDIPMIRHYFSDYGVSSGRVYEFEVEPRANIFRDLRDYTDKVYAISNIQELGEVVKSDMLKIMALDIETVQEDGKNKIIMFSYFTNFREKGVVSVGSVSLDYAVKVGSEIELIKKLIDVVNNLDVDVIVTYNGDDFDLKVLKEKASSYGIDFSLGRFGKKVESRKKGRGSAHYVFGRPHIDLYQYVSRILAPTLNVDVLTLDAVASELIGEGKKDMSWERMAELWEKNEDLNEVAVYCLNDSEITLKLALFLFSQIVSLSDITKTIFEEVSRSTYGNLVENYAIRYAKKHNVLVPNKPTQQDVIERYRMGEYEGAFVVEPKPGLYENIVVFDFRSLYPSIIITHNIDPFTVSYVCDENKKVPGYSYCFLEAPKGFIPKALKHVYDKRIAIKTKLKFLDKSSKEYVFYKAEDYALKTILNSFYGYLGFVNSRWYKRECAQAVTAYGRYYIKQIIEFIESRGYKVVYGDTDSVFILLGKHSLNDALKLLEEINASLPGIIKMDYQGYYVRGIFVSKKERQGGAKKRYALLDENGSIIIRGFERVRRDWSRLAKETQQKVLEYVLNNRIEDAKKYVREVINKLKRKEVDLKDLIIYTKLQKSLSSYDVSAPHVVVAKKLKQRGKKIFSGMIIGYIITSKKASKISEKAEPYMWAKDYDVDYYIHNQVLPAAMRVFSALNITEDEILKGTKQKTLF